MKGVVRVKLQPEVTSKVGSHIRTAAVGHLTTGDRSLDASLKTISGVSLRPVFPYSERYAAERAKFGLDQWYEVVFDEKVDPREAQRVLASTPGVAKSTVRVPMTLKEGTGDFRVLPASAATPAASGAPFNDPRLGAQWHYHNTGTIPGTVAGADINLFKAWETTTGSPEVIVAVIDGGIDYTHEDLAANVLVNEAELNGLPGVDDDGNGYVDDIYGYNFCTGSGEIFPHSHGTHVAGTVAAVNNNGKGVCGVAGGDGTPGSGVRMVSCQVFDSRSGTDTGDFAAAFVYAAERGASIAQCSWGWDAPGYYEEDVLDAIRYFTSMNRTDKLTGGLAVFSTGNYGITGDCYPACMDEVIAVASMQADYHFATYSNFGEWVDIVAPGGQMDFDPQLGVLSTLPDNSYGFNEGTSMASPHVSGIAALVLSKYGQSTFPMSTLRQQIVSSVNDFYAFNPDVRGMFGSGYADAAKALVMGDGSAPAAVEKMTLYPGQDVITVEWNIPASSSGSVNHHVLYYSTAEFSESSLDGVPSVVIDTKFLSSGDKFTYELGGLESLTDYYLAIKAVDRWGNASSLSPVMKTTTNAGSRMTLDTDYISLELSSPSASPKATFHVGNEDAGLLKWSVSARRTLPSFISWASVGGPANIAQSYTGTLGAETAALPATVAAYESFDQDDYPRSFTNARSLYAYIGDADKTLPNAMAQQFTVDATEFPDGFNLTHINLQGVYGTDPVVEVYGGKGIFNASNLLLGFTPDFFAYNYDIQLPEQLFFNAGDSFWIVVKFPAQENLYPLGLGTSNGAASASGSYMSNDDGATWTPLKQVLAGTRYESMSAEATWCISAVTMNPAWSDILKITPSSGTVKQGESQEVTVSLANVSIPNGMYGAKLYFDTNESEKNESSVTVDLYVKGQKPDVVADKVVPFGNLLVGETKTLLVEVYNKGYGTFAPDDTPGNIFSENIISTNENFRGPDYVSGGFQARKASAVEITFAPKTAGAHTGSIIFNGPDGTQLKIMVTGVATDPAKMEIDPVEINVGELKASGSTVKKEFTVSNTGSYPLEFVFPKYSTETILGDTGKKIHRFGYTCESNLRENPGVEYDGVPDIIEPVDVTGEFTDDVKFTKAIDLGFDFPYYGKNYSRVYITSFGGVVFVHDASVYVNMYGPLTPGSNGVKGSGLICAYGYQLMMGAGSKVEYGKVDGKFVINFSNVLALVSNGQYTPISFHMSLSPDGDIYVAYDDYSSVGLFHSGETLFLAINDLNVSDPLIVTSADAVYGESDFVVGTPTTYYEIGSGSAFRFVAPRPNIVSAVSPVSGLLAPGESMKVTATLKAPSDINAGSTFTNLVVNSNDPLNSPAFVRFNAEITGNLAPALESGDGKLDFGKVFRTSEARQVVNVRNTGRDVMHVSSATFAGGLFSVSTAVPFDVPAKQSKDIVVVLPTEKEGPVSDVLTISTDCGEMKVEVTGEVIGVPAVTLGYENVNETLAYGDSKSLPLTVANSGNEPLTFSLSAGPHIRHTPAASTASEVAYAYAGSVDDSSVGFDWVDIADNGVGEHANLTALMNNDFVTVQLPFEFSYYGKKYTTMYVYNTGFVSFTKYGDSKDWPEPPQDFPKGSTFTNLIAPYWGLHSPAESRTSGVYWTVDGDRAVVSWMEYGNSMNFGVCFQLILRKDGSFRFQYKGDGDDAQLFALFGHVGLSSPGASYGVEIPARFINFGRAIEFTPVVTETVAPGASVTSDIVLTADDLAGEYESAINLSTNIPGKEKIEIPVKMTVTGEVKPVLPAEITVEHPVGFMSADFSDPLVQMGARYAAYFDIGNEGTAPFSIESIEVKSPKVVDPMYGDEMDLLWLFYYGERENFYTGEMEKGWYMTDGNISFPVRRESIRFAVPMFECEQAYAEGTYTMELVFHLAGIEGKDTHTVKVNLVVTPAPKIEFDKEEIRISNADDDFVSTESFVIRNTGEYPLDYELTVDPTGEGESLEPDSGDGGIAVTRAASAPAAAPAPVSAEAVASSITPADAGKSDFYLDAPQITGFEYSSALYHPAAEGTQSVWNYGTNNTYSIYKASTLFTGPEGGFNISHIYAMSMFGDYENVDYTVEIIRGDDPSDSDAVVLGTGVYHHGDAYTGSDKNATRAFLIPLRRPVFVSEGEDFCVVITFPKGNKYPSTLCAKADPVVSNRYMGYTEEYGWYDVASLFKEQNGSLGYVMSAVQTTEGSSWIALEPGQAVSGRVAPGEEREVRLNLNAAAAPLDLGNKAVVVVKSNDPESQIVNFPVYLDKNAAPVITAPSGTLAVNPGEKLSATLTVSEPEGEAMTLVLDDNASISRISSVTAFDPSAEVTLADDGLSATVSPTSQGVKVVVMLQPSIIDRGDYSFTLTASDSHGHESFASVPYRVAEVNRAPVPVEVEPIIVPVGGASLPVVFADLFEDPDGDELTFSLRMSEEGTVSTYLSDNGAVFAGVKEGKVSAFVRAEDPDGAYAECEIPVEVSGSVGIDGITIESGVRIYPNPVVDVLHLAFGFSDSSVAMNVYSISGAKVLGHKAAVAEGDTVDMDMSRLPAGTYVLSVVTSEGASAAYIVIKER